MATTFISKMTDAEVYLEYFNDWITTKRMSEFYAIPESELIVRIDNGRIQHEQLVRANKRMKDNAKDLFNMVQSLKQAIARLTKDGVSQFERDAEAQWIGEAHELLLRIDPNYKTSK